MRYALALILLLMQGCAVFDDAEYNIERKIFVLRIEFDETLQYDGLAEWRNGYCKITLKNYPKCLAHEVRHCIEGHWHDGKHNGEYCY